MKRTKNQKKLEADIQTSQKKQKVFLSGYSESDKMFGIFLGIVFLIIAIVALFFKKADKDEQPLLPQGIWTLIIVASLIICPLSILGFDCIVTVDAGTVGVQNTFGNIASDELTPGISFKNPFTDVIQYSTQTQQVFEISSVPSKEGLIVTLDVSILYKIMPTKADFIAQNLGDTYSDTVIVSQLRSIVREITAKYEAKALYTVGRENITNEIFDVLEPVLAERGIILEKVLLRDLQLPTTVTTSIEKKLAAEQEALQMQFVLQKETQEAERKRVEARGIADAQAIIHESLTPAYLTWYFISHLKDMDGTYFVPLGSSGLPLFFDMQGLVNK